ncbi:MAG TPA: holo-ACP synthase [Actinomycetota bacterium]|nr:holo-ACP synthase [Actinomycetota bacterium]
MEILGIGVDVVDVGRIRRMLERHRRFRERVFTPDEVAYCETKANRAERYAARWAAREATIKALGGVRGLRYHDISVGRHRSGAPRIVLSGSARARAADRGVRDVLVSFSHERDTTVAFCIAVGRAP